MDRSASEFNRLKEKKIDGNNFGNNDQNNAGNGGYQNTEGTDNQYGSYQNGQNPQGTDGQYSGYQNNQNNQNNQGNGQYGSYQNNQGNGQYGSYQNNQGNGQYNGYQNNQAGTQYGNYQDYTRQASPYPAPVINNSMKEKANGLQVAGLVCGILAICACCCYGVVSIVLGVAGLICSITGNNRNKNGVGIAGIVCSVIGLVLGIASLIYYIWAFAYLDEIGYFDEIIKELYR